MTEKGVLLSIACDTLMFSRLHHTIEMRARLLATAFYSNSYNISQSFVLNLNVKSTSKLSTQANAYLHLKANLSYQNNGYTMKGEIVIPTPPSRSRKKCKPPRAHILDPNAQCKHPTPLHSAAANACPPSARAGSLGANVRKSHRGDVSPGPRRLVSYHVEILGAMGSGQRSRRFFDANVAVEFVCVSRSWT
jgi:hypothetical protein